MIPYFNAGIFLENKQQIGKVDEILGPMKQYVREKKSNLIAIDFLFLFSGFLYHSWKI
jgi:rRNA processing protein Gar1